MLISIKMLHTAYIKTTSAEIVVKRHLQAFRGTSYTATEIRIPRNTSSLMLISQCLLIT